MNDDINARLARIEHNQRLAAATAYGVTIAVLIAVAAAYVYALVT